MVDQQTFTNEELDTFDSIRERDVDLGIVLALRASVTARQRFAAAVGRSEVMLVSACTSLSTPDGREADIVLSIGRADDPIVIEIENKIGAVFQQGQAESYAQRALEHRVGDRPGEGYAVLFAPQRYLASHAATAAFFDGVVSYEEIRDALVNDGEWGRSIALLLEHGIRQHRRGGAVSPDSEERTVFFAAFSELAAGYGLPPIPPKPRKVSAGFLWYPKRGTLSQVVGWDLTNHVHGAWLGAKIVHGHADIELTGVCPVVDVDILRSAIDRVDGLELAVDSTSARFRRIAPKLDPDQPLESQLPEAQTFAACLVELRDWWESEGRGLVRSALL